MKITQARELESAGLQSSMGEEGSASSAVAMVGCMLSLLMMLCACSPQPHAEVSPMEAVRVKASAHRVAAPTPEEALVLQAKRSDAFTDEGVYMGRLMVGPQ